MAEKKVVWYNTYQIYCFVNDENYYCLHWKRGCYDRTAEII